MNAHDSSCVLRRGLGYTFECEHTMCRRTFLICYARSENLLCLRADEHVPRNEIIEIILLSVLYIFSRIPSVYFIFEKHNFANEMNCASRSRILLINRNEHESEDYMISLLHNDSRCHRFWIKKYPVISKFHQSWHKSN